MHPGTHYMDHILNPMELTPLARQEFTVYNEYRYWDIQMDGCAWDHTYPVNVHLGGLLLMW